MGGFGNSFEQTIGIITAGTEIMVGQPSKVARGWRTIGANISKLAKETDTYKDASGKVNIEMRKQDGTMKNTYEFLSDLHKSWGSLNKEQKTAIALQMGGKNQMEVFMATMDNFDTAIEATNTAMDAQGSASQENAKAIESLQGHLQNLKRAWEEFSYTMVKSDMLKKGMDILTSALEFLSSDTGQAIIKLSLLATGLNLFAKAALGLKGLSLVKLFSGLGKGAKGATDGLKVMQGAQVGATKGAIPLYSAFGKLTGSLLGSAGLVAGIGLLSVALAEYVPIGEKARDIKLGKELKEAQSDAEKTEKKYKSLCDELDRLHEKEKEGTLTDSEQNRLNILENQTKQYERQVELKNQLAGNKADEYYHTVDPDKLEGKAKEKYVKEMSVPGRTEQQALASVGINDKIALSLNNVRARADEVTKAQQKVTEAYEKYGEDSPQWTKASEELVKAQEKLGTSETKQGDVLTQLQKKRKDAIDDYGSVKKANQALGDSWKDLNREISSLKVLKGLNFKKPSKDIANLKKNAKTLGLEFDKSGKKINKIDLKSFSQKMIEAGWNVEDTWGYIKKLGKENPKLKVNVDGADVAVKDLEFVDGKIQKIDDTPADVEVDADTKDAKDKLDDIRRDKNLGKAEKKIKQSGASRVQSWMKTLTKQKSLGSAKKKITQSGAGTVESKLGTLSRKKSLGTATKKISFSVSGLTAKLKSFLGLKKGVKHFAGGGKSDILDNAEVNEQGFEIIRDDKTGLLRVANGGKRGTTHLNRGDSVYTHGQSVRMLRRMGLTEGSVLQGRGNEDFGLLGLRKLPGFKGGKLTQKQYNKKYNKILSNFDKALATLEYKKDKEHWLDSTYITYYGKLITKYTNKIKSLNKKKVKKGVKKKKTLGTDRLRAYYLAKSSQQQEDAIESISGYVEGHRLTDKELSTALNKINTARKNKKISADEAAQYRKEAYKKNLEYNLKLYENDKKTYASSLELIKSYYKKGMITSEEYYQYVEDLAKTQLEKEKARLSEQQSLNQDTYSLAKGYVQKQIDLLEKENEEQEKQNELVELQNNLAKARNKRIRIYKEGEGFVYEQDTEAIREATQALQEYQSQAENPVLAKWKKVLELFDEYETDAELKALENSVGSTVGKLFGSLGVDTSAWASWIKNNLSTNYGLQNVLDDMEKLVDANDILAYLDSNGQVSNAIIQGAIANNALPATYAAAITQAALASESVVGSSVGISQQSAIASATNGAGVSGILSQYGNVYNFDNLVLPNVTNATEFINELNSLSTTALQVTTQRV